MEEKKKGTLAIVSGFSGVGKGTVVRKMVEEYGYALSISATTRQPRTGEEDGVSYFFITREEFEKRIAENDFFEYAQYVGNYYGTPKSFVMNMLEEGRDVILEIESEGAFKVKEQYPQALLIYMLPPSMKELKNRLVGRGTETEDVIAKRLKKAVESEMDRAEKYDFLIVNEEVDACAMELSRMIKTRTGISPKWTELLKKLREEAETLDL